MVTATNGTATFVGARTRKVYNASFYIADVVTTKVKWQLQGKAGAGDTAYIQLPEDAYFVGASILTGPTVSSVLIPTRNEANVPNAVVAIADNLNTLTTRVPYRIPVRMNERFGFVEA